MTGSGVRTPATTSSPWAFIMNSPQKIFSPVAGSRVKATPEPEFSPVLPKTIDCTLTAVPHSTGMLYLRRYTIARSFIHELNTAPIEPRS